MSWQRLLQQKGSCPRRSHGLERTSSISGYAQHSGVDRFCAASGGTELRLLTMEAYSARMSPLER